MPSDRAWPEESRLWPPHPLSMRPRHAGRSRLLRVRLRLRVARWKRWRQESGLQTEAEGRAEQWRSVKSHRQHETTEGVRPYRS